MVVVVLRRIKTHIFFRCRVDFADTNIIIVVCIPIMIYRLVTLSLYRSVMLDVSGNSAVQAIELLLRKGVPEAHIIFLNLISVSIVGR